MNAKQAAAAAAVAYLKNGMRIGLGTGTTAYWAIQYTAEKVKQGLDIQAIATSLQTENLAKSLGIKIISFADTDRLDLTIDGADEVDNRLSLIKGGGGALLREKIVAAASSFYIIIAEESKNVSTLGKFKLPVEILRFGHERIGKQLAAMAVNAAFRKSGQDLFITDNGNYIVDCDFGQIMDPKNLHEKINSITGVVDNGLFIDMADLVIFGNEAGGIRTCSRLQ